VHVTNNAVQKQATLGLPWTRQGEKANAKPSNSLAKKKKLWATSSKHNLTSCLWLVSILWPRRPWCCDRYMYMTSVIKTSLSFHLRVSKSARQNTTHLQKRNIWTAKIAALNFRGLRETRTQALHVICQKFTSEWVNICIFCPITIVVSMLRVSTTKTESLPSNFAIV